MVRVEEVTGKPAIPVAPNPERAALTVEEEVVALEEVAESVKTVEPVSAF